VKGTKQKRMDQRKGIRNEEIKKERDEERGKKKEGQIVTYFIVYIY
jgi:hypothetical protein